MNPWTVACQALLSMGLPHQEYLSWLPFPSPGDLSNPGMEPVSPALAGRFLTAEPPGKPLTVVRGGFKDKSDCVFVLVKPSHNLRKQLGWNLHFSLCLQNSVHQSLPPTLPHWLSPCGLKILAHAIFFHRNTISYLLDPASVPTKKSAWNPFFSVCFPYCTLQFIDPCLQTRMLRPGEKRLVQVWWWE